MVSLIYVVIGAVVDCADDVIDACGLFSTLLRTQAFNRSPCVSLKDTILSAVCTPRALYSRVSALGNAHEGNGRVPQTPDDDRDTISLLAHTM